MDKGTKKLRYNPYNLRLTQYRRQREIPDMPRPSRFLPDPDNGDELVAVEDYVPADPRQLGHQQPQHQRRAHNRQRARPRQRQHAHPGQARRLQAQPQPGGSVWSAKEDKLLFKAVAHFKKCNKKSSSLQWGDIYGFYTLLGGAGRDVKQLQIHWRKIKELEKIGHLNDCSFFNDPDCFKDFNLVFEEGSSSSMRNEGSSSSMRNEGSSSSMSSSSTATMGDASDSCSTFVPVQGDLSPEDRRILEVLVANIGAINELVGHQMIDEREAAFAKQKFANVNESSAMEHFSFLTNRVAQAHFIRCAMNQSHP